MRTTLNSESGDKLSAERGYFRTASVIAMVTWSLAISRAGAYPISSVFIVNPVNSSLSVKASAYGFSDTDANSLAGSMNATLDLGASGSLPGAGAFTITGGTITPDGNYSLRLGFPPFLGVNIQASGLTASVSTLEPPGTITRATPTGAIYNLDAANLLVSVNQGTIVVTGSTNETTDLSADPVAGSAPEGTLGSLTLTTSGTNGLYTRINALLTLPINIEQSSDLEGGNGKVAATGTLNATSSFYVALSGIPGDFQLNGAVDDADLAIWKSGFGVAAGATASNGDANADGLVDGADLLIWQGSHGTQPPAIGSDLATLPEPGTLGTCLAALTAIGMMRLRRGVSALNPPCGRCG